MVYFSHCSHGEPPRFSWTLRADVEFYGGRLSKKEVGSSHRVAPDDYLTELEILPGQGLFHLRLYGLWRESFASKLRRSCDRIDLSMAYHYQGHYENFTIRGKPGRLNETVFGQITPSYTWNFNPSSLQVGRLLTAFATHRQLVHIAVYGTGRFLEEIPTLQRQPTQVERTHPFVSMAALVTMMDSDFIYLAPTLPAGERRVLRAHQGILCEVSDYFAALLASDFAEAASVRETKRQCNTSSRTRMQTRGTTTVSSLHVHGSHSETPIVKVEEITYEQLQTLLFFIHTGEAVFEMPTITDDDDKDGGTSSGGDRGRNEASARTPALDTSIASTSSFLNNNVQWWNGILEPANAFDMFRIADKYCIEGLRSAALQHISKNICAPRLEVDLQEREEITLFPDVKDVYRNYCIAWWFRLERRLDEMLKATLDLDMTEVRPQGWGVWNTTSARH